jgi:hypothetical protein
MKEYGWLLGELPFTRKETSVLNDCLEAYGRAIISAQQKVPVIRQVFSRLKTAVERDLASSNVPRFALERISSSGNVSFVYKLTNNPIPTDKAKLQSLINSGLLSQDEVKAGTYLAIDLHYEYIFTEPSDVFRFVNNFSVTPLAIKLANSNLIC